jgi:hypothetical protein
VQTVPNIVHVQLRYSSVCVCAWWVPRNVMEVHNNLFTGAPLLVHSYKGGANEFSESVVTVRHGFTILLEL